MVQSNETAGMEGQGEKDRLINCFQLSRSAPDTSKESILSGQSVDAVIGLSFTPDEAGESVSDVLAWNGFTFIVNLGNIDLD